MVEKKRIRVMIADDDRKIRQMLETLFDVTEDIELVAQSAHGAAAVRDCVLYQPDVALIDLHMPFMDGLEAIRTIGQLAPQTRLIVYSANAAQVSPKLLLAAGAVGFVEKSAPITTILRAIRNAYTDRSNGSGLPLEEEGIARIAPEPPTKAKAKNVLANLYRASDGQVPLR
jgi:DNA-binding NarL/FixJ family response regulator